MKYTVRCYNDRKGYFMTEVEASPVILMEGFSFIVHRTLFDRPRKDIEHMMNDWSVTEVSSGYVVATGPTDVKAILRAEEHLKDNEELFRTMVAKAVEQNKILFV